jgi:hypothetical protein
LLGSSLTLALVQGNEKEKTSDQDRENTRPKISTVEGLLYQESASFIEALPIVVVLGINTRQSKVDKAWLLGLRFPRLRLRAALCISQWQKQDSHRASSKYSD